jgi:uncharacterized repeat protein (TIGR03803 family)
MTIIRLFVTSATLFSVLALSTAHAVAQTLKTLYSFAGGSDGDTSAAGVAIGSGGVLYGTTYGGSLGNAGTVFKLSPPATMGGKWSETLLQFGDGANPDAGVLIGRDGALYGTTYNGGVCSLSCENGTVFALRPPASAGGAWTEKLLHTFAGYPTDGSNPTAGLAEGKDGVLYGTTNNGGAADAGTVFSLAPPDAPDGSWTETVLHNFAFATGGSDGSNPYAGVVIGKGGVLYGTCFNGGTSYYGTVFSLTPPSSAGGAWTEDILYTFTGGSSSGPHGGLAIGKDGVLYGTTFGDNGTVFSPGGPWTETVLYTFMGGTDGAAPAGGVVIGRGGVLYGTTQSGGRGACVSHQPCGTVFSLIPPASPGGAWTEKVLHRFTGGADGGTPYDNGGIAIGAHGLLYGTTAVGGAFNFGTVFSLDP